MKLFIPSVGTKLQLTSDWEFTLFFEYRNQKMVNYLKPGAMKDSWTHDNGQSLQATLPIGTVLAVDRVYIRAGASSAYNSITFRTKGTSRGGLRFWVKLDDANNIEAEIVK